LVIFNPQVEWYEGDSCHDLSIPIIQVTAGILLSNQEQVTEFRVLTRRKGIVELKPLPIPKTKLLKSLEDLLKLSH